MEALKNATRVLSAQLIKKIVVRVDTVFPVGLWSMGPSQPATYFLISPLYFPTLCTSLPAGSGKRRWFTLRFGL